MARRWLATALLALACYDPLGRCFGFDFTTQLVNHGRHLEEFPLPNVKYQLPGKAYLTSLPGFQNLSAHHEASDESGRHAGGSHGSPARWRCAVTRGSWCRQALEEREQRAAAARPVPRGAKDCPGGCSGWGNCNHDTGLCECPAGRGGPDCGQEEKRPCSNRYRHPHENTSVPAGHIGPDKHDLDIKEEGWLASRCNGYCVDDLALCTCGYDSQYRHIPAPPGSPPWTPPVQWGRPMGDHCMIGVDKDGSRISWGVQSVTWDKMYGPKGWCNAPAPIEHCGCFWDGNGWPCDGSRRYEAFCVNQCSGHGDCHMGFCRCHPGWYGADCSRKRAGLDMEPGYADVGGPATRPWLVGVVQLPPAALPAPPAPTRPRPLIYVYDMPPAYTSRMLQYRLSADACMWRRFTEGNGSYPLTLGYSVELHLHEMLLQSEHRTFDPEEADFFYVPMYICCYMWPVLGWADHPWWHAPFAHMRPLHASNMVAEAQEWLASNHPWWNRRGGRDHIWLMAHDEGACYMPTHVYNASIVLTHWGRTDLVHKSGTAYFQDDYSNVLNQMDLARAFRPHGWKGLDWHERLQGHPCYSPDKDLVIPGFKQPEHYRESPLMGAPPLARDILLYFRGDVGAHRLPKYSRGIRQRLCQLAHAGNWAEKHRIYIGTGDMIPGSYSEHLARSKFCLVAPGDGFSMRAEDAVLHGCVPLVVMDGVHAVFESILDWEAFSIRIRESALEAVPAILEAVPPTRLAKLQRNLAKVWHRFAWGTGPLMQRFMAGVQEGHANAHPRDVRAAAANLTAADTPFRPLAAFPAEDDAFGTIMQWLAHRIPATR